MTGNTFVVAGLILSGDLGKILRRAKEQDIIIVDSRLRGEAGGAATNVRLWVQTEDEANARRMLSTISGTRHQVTTGLALLVPATADEKYRRLLAAETTYVTMRRVSHEEIDQYVASGEWRDKAGAYAIQESAAAFIETVDGSFTNVVGLPMELLAQMLAKVPKLLSERDG